MSGYLEHLAGSLAVTSGDQRGVHINEVSLLEELMDRIGAEGTHTEYCLEGVGSRAQMGNGSQGIPRSGAFSAAGNPVRKRPLR